MEVARVDARFFFSRSPHMTSSSTPTVPAASVTAATHIQHPLRLPEFTEFNDRLVMHITKTTKHFGDPATPHAVEEAYVTLDGKRIAHEQIFRTDFSRCFARLSNSVKDALTKMRLHDSGSSISSRNVAA